MHSEGGGNHSSPQTRNQHIQLPVRNISRLISPRHFYNIALLSRGMLSWEITRKSGSDGWRWRQSERQQGRKSVTTETREQKQTGGRGWTCEGETADSVEK